MIRISGLLIAVSAAVFALTPFRYPFDMSAGPPSAVRLVSSCGWPLGDATRSVHTGAWFGYSPGAIGEVTVPGHLGCPRAAQHRLRLSLAGLILASLLGAIAIGLDRRREFAGSTGARFAT